MVIDTNVKTSIFMIPPQQWCGQEYSRLNFNERFGLTDCTNEANT